METKYATLGQQAWLWMTAAAVVAFDQLTKWRIEANYGLGEASYPIESISHIFRIVHVYNRGVAFGSLQGFGWFASIVAALVTVYLLYTNYTTPGSHRLFRVSMGFILGGAIGNNLLDRIRLGHVTDFIHFNLRPLVADYPALDFQILNWPVFNWADTFIVSGVIIMGVLMWTNRLPEEVVGTIETAAPPEPPPPSRPVESLAVYDPVLPDPAGSPADSRSWELSRFGAWALILLAVGGLAWFAGVWVNLRRGRKRRGRRANL